MDYKDKMDLEPNGEMAKEDIAVPYIAETPVMTLDSLYDMLQPLDSTSKMWLIDKLSDDVKKDVHDYAKRICSEEEYSRLKSEGFLDSPVPQHEPSTKDELLEEVKDFHSSGYLSAEDTEKWFEELVS